MSRIRTRAAVLLVTALALAASMAVAEPVAIKIGRAHV